MPCDNLCGFKRNGWHDTACPESSDSKKAYALETNPKYWVDFDGADLCKRDGSAFATMHAAHCDSTPEELEEIHRFLSTGEEMEAKIERLSNERDRFQKEAWTLRESLVSVREMIWNKDVPSPQTPDLREWHENCQKFMKFIDSALAAKEGE